MPHPTRFSYASTSTALPSTIKDHLVSITRNAETNTARGEMAGILIYGNKCFFHCIEAPASTINRIYNEAVQNPLDQRFELLKRELISERYFKGWEIKYFVREKALQEFFLEHYGKHEFDPYVLEGNRLDAFIKLLARPKHERLSGFPCPIEASLFAGSSSSGRLLNTHYIGFMMMVAILIFLFYLMMDHYMGWDTFQSIYRS